MGGLAIYLRCKEYEELGDKEVRILWRKYIAKRKLAELRNAKIILELYHDDYKDVKLIEEIRVGS